MATTEATQGRDRAGVIAAHGECRCPHVPHLADCLVGTLIVLAAQQEPAELNR